MPPAGLDNLKHIVVLMMETRSFDPMLGFAQSDTWPIDGLKGTETNVDSAGGAAQVSSDARYAGDFTPDPGHAVLDTLTQLYVDANTLVTQDPSMGGFVQSYEGKTGKPQDAHRIMKCFLRADCRRWFPSLSSSPSATAGFLRSRGPHSQIALMLTAPRPLAASIWGSIGSTCPRPSTSCLPRTIWTPEFITTTRPWP